MSSEIITTVASAWMLLVVAGVGVASLPWTALELTESAAAYGQLWRWMRGWVAPRSAAVAPCGATVAPCGATVVRSR